MHRFLPTFPLMLGLVLGCSGDDSSSSNGPSTGGTSSGGAGGSGATATGGSGNSATGGAAGSATGGSGGGTGGIPSGPDIQNLSESNVTAFPASIGFASDDYDDVLGVVWTTAGATHEYMPNNGWNGGGAARFTPPTAEGYSGIGSFHFASGLTTTHLSMRWLMKAGPTMGQYGSGNKTLLFVREPNDDTHHRPMIITRPDPAHTDAFVPGACDGTVCQYKVGAGSEPFWPDGSDTFWISPSGYAEEWVSWEFEVDAQAGWIRLYLTTQDGVFNDTLYVENPMVDSQPGGTFQYIDILGGYFGASQADAGNWFELDEVVIHNQHIGPPPAFVQ